MTKRPFEPSTCIICYDEIKSDEEIVTKCNHHYCVTCFVYNMRVSNECAMCRKEIVPDKPKEMLKMDSDLIINMTDFIMRSFIYEEGLISMCANLTNKFNAKLNKFIRSKNITVTRSTQQIIDVCGDIINDGMKLEYDLWMYTLKCVRSVARWYDNNEVVFSTPAYTPPPSPSESETEVAPQPTMTENDTGVVPPVEHEFNQL